MNINKLTHQLIRGLLPESREHVNEVGEASSKIYPYARQHEDFEVEGDRIFGTTVYNFITDNDSYYDVIFSYYTTPEGENGVSIDFTAEESYEMTNKGELFKVMGTVVDIIRTELNRPKIKQYIDFITYLPAKNKSKVGATGGDIQRDKLYRAFIKKQIPNVVEKPGPGGLTYFYIKESYEGKRTDKGAPGTLKAKITKLYGGDVTIEKAKKLKNRENATAHDKRQANWFINFHSKNEAMQGQSAEVDFRGLEKELDAMFDDLDIDIEFTKHFKERVLERGLTETDIVDLMEKIHDRYGEQIADLPKGSNRVFTHLTRLVDISSAVGGYDYDGLKDLYLTTAYKRRNRQEPEFRTSHTSPKLKVSEEKNTSLLVRKTNKVFPTDTGKAAPYGSGYTRLKKESGDYQEQSTQDTLTPYIVDLTKHMFKKGLNIDPAPEIEFVEDPTNAEDLLGKTAYYDPGKQMIVLYITGRHPKDILRSFAHEMIHHCQNIEGRLGNIKTQNINEDDYLKELEREAYEQGNILFREWENALKK